MVCNRLAMRALSLALSATSLYVADGVKLTFKVKEVSGEADSLSHHATILKWWTANSGWSEEIIGDGDDSGLRLQMRKDEAMARQLQLEEDEALARQFQQELMFQQQKDDWEMAIGLQ